MFGDGFGVLIRNFDEAEQDVGKAAAEFAERVVISRRIIRTRCRESSAEGECQEQNGEQFRFHAGTIPGTVAARNAFTPQTRLAVYGWGMIRKRTADAMAFVVNDLPKDDTAEFLDPESPFLQVGTPLYFVPPKACLATPGYAGFVRPDMICAGVASGKIDQCNGDSGGPLMQQGSGSSAPVLVGIVEGGDGCGLAHTPGVYVYVPAYRDWIARTIGRGSLRKGRAILAAAGRKTT